MQILILSLVALAGIIFALVGIIIPGLPGIPVLWVLLAVDYWLLGYLELSGTTMVWLTILAVLTIVIDDLATALGVKKRGGSLLGIIGSIVGLITGLAIGQFPGMLFGCFLGALVGELITGKELKQSAHIALGALFGYASATVFKLATLVVYTVVIFYNILS